MQKKISLYVHLVWRTWDSLPLITPEIERRLYRNIQSEAQKMKCTVLALNGSADHVHLLVMLPTTLTVAELMQRVKGVSSHFVNNVLGSLEPFKWQGGYGAFSVSRWDVEKIKKYIQRQKEHHQTNELWQELEQAVEFQSHD
jgi:REP element-mobilizing transposase RayT